MTKGPNPRPVIERLLEKIEITENGCWLWTGALNSHGYGNFYAAPGVTISAHRAMYELLVGTIPEGLELDHVRERGCTSRACCNPDHLEPVTHAENLRRAMPLVTHCLQGHPYDETNTYVSPRGRRNCRSCGRSTAAKRRTAKGLALAVIAVLGGCLYGAVFATVLWLLIGVGVWLVLR